MSPLPEGIRRAFRLDRRGAGATDEVSDEIRFHLEQRTAELVAAGWTAERARAEAERRFGSIRRWERTIAAEDRLRVQRERRYEWWDALARDLRYTGRVLRRQPLFTAGIVATLALGIGANASMFGIVDRLLLRAPAHVHDAGSLRRLYVETNSPDRGREISTSFSYPLYATLRDSSGTLSGVGAWTSRRLALSEPGASGDAATEARVIAATASLFPTLGVRPYLGRFYGEGEDQPPDGSRVVVLGFDVWQARFGADSAIVGRQLRLGLDSYEVIGVAPPGFTGANLSRVDAWIPLTSIGQATIGSWVTDRPWWEATNVGWLSIVTRLRPGSAADAAAAELTVLNRRVDERDASPAQLTALGRRPASAVLGPIQRERGPNPSEGSRVAVWLLAVSALVLLIACANVANLLLARGLRRRRELAVRVALGAGRGGLLRQLVIEALVLATLGGAAALLLAHWGSGLVRGILLPDLELGTQLADWRVILFTLVAALLTGLLAGVMPALRASRPDITSGLRAGAREGGGRRSFARTGLLVSQAALSVILLVGAGLFLRSLSNVTSVPLGFEPGGVLTLRADFGAAGYDTERSMQLYEELLERVQRLPGVEHASLSLTAPMFTVIRAATFTADGDSVRTADGRSPMLNLVGAEYFSTIGTRVVRGRGFTDDDRAGAALVAVVSETFARRQWPGEDALGQCIRVGDDASAACREVVGVAENTRWTELREEAGMQFYLPTAQRQREYPFRELLVRVGSPEVAAAVERSVRAELREIAPNVALARLEPLQANIDPELRSWRLGASMFSAFGVLALVLAAVGLYSVLAFTVASRLHEMSVRMALGARPGDVIRLIAGEGLRVTALGVAIGAAVTLAFAPRLQSLLFDTPARDPVVLGGVAAVLLVVALIASAGPALRATRAEAGAALRAE